MLQDGFQSLDEQLAQHEKWIREALNDARSASAADEVPVGAIVVCGDSIIGRGCDRKIEFSDPSAHAEMLAIRQAASQRGDWRLEDCALYVTLEPCPMCAGAALLARVPLIVYGAENFKFGACGTIDNLFAEENRWNHKVDVVSGILAEECAEILSDYFRQKRKKKDC